MIKCVENKKLGIMSKPDSDAMWSSNINTLKIKPNSTFLNVGCGYSTEAVLLAKKLVKTKLYTQEEAVDSIYLLDKYDMFTNMAKAKGFKNIVCTDFLQWETDMKFNNILMNPPYGSTVSIYHKFIEKTLEMLSDDGQACFVVPVSWLLQGNKGKDGKKMRRLLKELKPYKIEMNNFDTFEKANVRTVNIFCSKENTSDKFVFVDEAKNELEATLDDLVPISVQPTALSILEKTGKQNQHPNIIRTNGTTGKWRIGTYRMHRGFSTGKNVFGPIDVITPEKDKLNHFMLGEYETQEEAEFAAEAFKSYWHSKLANCMLKLTKSSYVFADYHLVSMPSFEPTKIWTDEELYKHFNLTQKEIDYVEQNS